MAMHSQTTISLHDLLSDLIFDFLSFSNKFIFVFSILIHTDIYWLLFDVDLHMNRM